MDQPANSFHALLSGRAYPGAGIATLARFDADRLLVNPPGLALESSALVVSVGGMEQAQLHLNWLDEDGGQLSLTPSAAADRELLLASAPASLQPQLRQWHQRKQNQQHIWRWISALLAGSVLLALLAWWSYPRLTGWLVERIPVSAEVQLGKLALAQLRLEGELIDSGPAQQAVQRIGGLLTKGSAYHYQWLIKKDRTVNAFAVPGGFIVVHTGLLEQTGSSDELAAVLAHEVQHIERRHSLRQLAASLGLAAAVGVTIGDVSGAAAMLAQQLGSSHFSRGMEQEADRYGYQALVQARIAPQGMASFFRKLARKENGATVPTWLSSHPATAERIASIEAMISQHPCAACRPLDSAGWQATVRAAAPAAP